MLLTMNDLSQNLLRQAAQRLNLSPDTLDGIAVTGDRARIGQILDDALRAQIGQHSPFNFGPFTVMPNERLLRGEQGDINLTEKELDILILLKDSEGQSVSRKTMLDRVWGYASGVETHTLETHIYRLRQKIEPDPAKPSLLLTDEQGYRLGPTK